MSKAMAFFEPGGPEVLRLIEVDELRAGPGQVRLRVRAAGVQPYDIAVVEGWVPPGVDPAFPRIPGNEFAGVVDQIGEGVTGFSIGDEVLGFGQLNSYREQLVIAADQITAKPANMSWEVAGGFTAGAQTAHIALRELGVGAGDTVLVHGAAGSVGTVAVQLARLWGATVIAAAREAQHDYLRSLGAIPVAYGDDFVERVLALAPEGVVHASLDGVGGAALEATLELVKDRERIVTLVEHGKAAELGIRVTPAKRSAARLAELADLYAQGKLTFHILEAFPLARAADAFLAYKAGGVRGKIVITMNEPTNAQLAAQPIGYWSEFAHREVVTFIRRELAALGLSQPQYWVLRHLSVDDLSPDGEGQTVAELTERMRGYLGESDDLGSAAEGLLERGWITRDAELRLWITEAGQAGHAMVKEHVPGIRQRIHAGIDDADYVVAVKVLRRMIRNVGGNPDAT